MGDAGDDALSSREAERVSLPTVTVGLPVLNGEATVSRAIQAILAQSHRDIELIISDNASSDGTLAICQAAAEDPRVRLIRRQTTLDAPEHFRAVLSAARGDCFMFAAADDWISPQAVADSLIMLEADASAVACAPRTLFHFDDGRVREGRGSKPIRGPGWLRPARFLLRPADNSRFYGLYRTECLRRAFALAPKVHAFDWLVSALTLVEGAHVGSRRTLLNREGGDVVRYVEDGLRRGANRRERLFPVLRMSILVLRHLPARHRPAAALALVFLNLCKMLETIRHAGLAPLSPPPDAGAGIRRR